MINALQIISVVYHNSGMEAERDRAAKGRFETKEDRDRLEMTVVDGEVWEVWEVVSEVGAALTSR